MKYIVTKVYESRPESQEAYYDLMHYEYDEKTEECIEKKGRYKSKSWWGVDNFVQGSPEYFEFNHYPSMKDVEDAVYECLDIAASTYEYYVSVQKAGVYDSDEDSMLENCKRITDEELLDNIWYENGNYEIYIDVEGFEVEEVES